MSLTFEVHDIWQHFKKEESRLAGLDETQSKRCMRGTKLITFFFRLVARLAWDKQAHGLNNCAAVFG